MLASAQTVEGQQRLADLSPPSNQDPVVPLEESPTMQAACEVELLNTDNFLEVLLETHPQVFALLVSPSVPTQADENSLTIAQVVSKKIYAQSQTPLSVTCMPLNTMSTWMYFPAKPTPRLACLRIVDMI
jgi:hypothetical protein